MEVKDHRGLVKLRSGDGAGSPEGGHMRDSSHQERQEFVPAQGNRAQVEQVRAFSAAVTPQGRRERPRRERMLPSPWRSSEIFLHLTPPLPKRDNPPPGEGKDEIYPSAQQTVTARPPSDPALPKNAQNLAHNGAGKRPS